MDMIQDGIGGLRAPVHALDANRRAVVVRRQGVLVAGRQRCRNQGRGDHDEELQLQRQEHHLRICRTVCLGECGERLWLAPGHLASWKPDQKLVSRSRVLDRSRRRNGDLAKSHDE